MAGEMGLQVRFEVVAEDLSRRLWCAKCEVYLGRVNKNTPLDGVYLRGLLTHQCAESAGDQLGDSE